MARFQFDTQKIKDNLYKLHFDKEKEANDFAQTLFKWKMPNILGNLAKKPLKLDDGYAFFVTGDELELINSYNAEEIPYFEKKFTVFDSLIMNAAQEVRLQFMSLPYKGSIHTDLAKQDYDEWQTVSFYEPPLPFTLSNSKVLYRSEVQQVAQEVCELLEKEGYGKKISSAIYELKFINTQAFYDSATNYDLYSISTDTLDDIHNHPQIKQWKDKKSPQETKRFLAIECKGNFYLYGWHYDNNQYQLITDETNKISGSVQTAFFSSHFKNYIQKEFPTEIMKNVIKYGQCHANHPSDENISKEELSTELELFSSVVALCFNHLVENNDTSIRSVGNGDDKKYYSTNEEAMNNFCQFVRTQIGALQKQEDGINFQFFDVDFTKTFTTQITPEEYELIKIKMPYHYVVRPNHGMLHSLRVANYVLPLVSHYREYDPQKCATMDENDIRLLQLAMLYSVVGRETEIGFSSEAKTEKLANSLDQSIQKLASKSASANAKEIAILQNKKNACIKKLRAEGIEYFTYRKNSALAFLAYCQKSGFSEQYCKAKGTHITTPFLSEKFAKNVIEHLLELQLISGTLAESFKNTDLSQIISYLKGINIQIVGEKPHQEFQFTLPTMHYHTLLLFKMSDPEYTDNLTDGFADIILQAHALDLIRCYPKIPDSPGSFSIGNIKDGLTIKKNASCALEAKNLVRFAIDSVKALGDRLTVDLNEEGEIIDKNTPVDFNKCLPASNDIRVALNHLMQVDIPDVDKLIKKLKYTSLEVADLSDPLNISSELPLINSCFKNKENDQQVDLVFSSNEEAKLFIKLMVQEQLLDPSTCAKDCQITLARKTFENIKDLLNYKTIKVCQSHVEEDNLVDADGNISGLKLISEGNALGRHIDSADMKDIKFEFDQLSDPINFRPPSRLHMHERSAHLLEFERQTVMNMFDKKLTTTIDDYVLNIDNTKIYKNEEWQALYASFKKDSPKRFEIFQYDNGSETSWYCYGQDSTGRYKSSILPSDLNISQLYKENKNTLSKLIAINMGHYKQFFRGIKDYQPLIHQVPIDEKGITLKTTREDYLINEQQATPISKFSDRGKPANTIFTPKMATTLLRTDGRTKLFDYDSLKSFIPVGILFDLNKVHLKGEKYIWKSNALSNARFWLGKTVERSIQSEWVNNVSLQELKTQLQDECRNPHISSQWNEMLVGLTKGAIKGFFVQEDHPARRLAMVMVYLYAKQEHKIDVPLFIVDGVNVPKIYTEKKLREDLKALFLAKKEGNINAFVSSLKNEKSQQKILAQLLDYVDYDKLSSEIDVQVSQAIEKINLIGGNAREQQYLKKHWEDNDQDIQKKLLARNKKLENEELVKQIETKQKTPHVSKI